MDSRQLKKSHLRLIQLLILTSSLVTIVQCKKFNLRIRRSEQYNVVNQSDPCKDDITVADQIETFETHPTDNPAESPTTPTSNDHFNDTFLDELYASLSDEFLKCADEDRFSTVKAECYEKWENGTVYIPAYSVYFNESNYFIDERNHLIVCSPDFIPPSNQKFDSWLGMATISGVGISLVCIILHMFMFLTFQKLRNLPGYCLFSLCCALTAAYISFLIGQTQYVNCTAVGLITFYGFLSSFFWMNTMSYDVWRSLRLATAKLRLTGDRPMLVRFGMYSLYSWGTPLLVLIIAFIVTYTVPEESKYKLDFNARTCWFQYKLALGVYFAFPIFSLLIVNVLLYVHSSFMISSATMKTSENSAFLWTRFFVSLRLAVVMGLTWIFGAISTATQQQVFNYFFCLCIALQGVFIFFSFTLTDKTKKACMMALKGLFCRT